MTHLTKPTQYNTEDSNIALLGSDLEKNVREHAGDKEAAWEHAGISKGLQIWRIEQFHIVEWPADRYDFFYDGDSYIVLHTCKKTPDDFSFSYNPHFWLGQRTTQDEAGTAAYKTVELDDHLHGIPVQYREVQGYESPQFLSYFPQFVSLRGDAKQTYVYRVKLLRHALIRPNLVVREMPAEASSLIKGDVYVLNLDSKILQLNTRESAGKERFKAAEFVRSLANGRKDESKVVVYDEGDPGATLFLTELGAEALISGSTEEGGGRVSLYQLSDGGGSTIFTPVIPSKDSLSTYDAFLLDDSQDSTNPAIYIWLGRRASLSERRLSLQDAQDYFHGKKRATNWTRVTIPIVKQDEGFEVADFINKLVGKYNSVHISNVYPSST